MVLGWNLIYKKNFKIMFSPRKLKKNLKNQKFALVSECSKKLFPRRSENYTFQSVILENVKIKSV